MPKHEEDDWMHTLASAFQGGHLETDHCSGIPFIENETAQFHLFRIIDFLNPQIWDEPSTNAISKDVILTLLQCAARLYEGGVHAKEAVDLIDNEDTRAILSLGVQGNLSKVIHQRCVESIQSNKSEATNAENCSRQAGLFSATRKNKARQLNHEAMIIEHISSLCRLHGAALQNTFDGPKTDEQFMFHNYITLSKTFNVCEKSWLVALLPDIFEWDCQNLCEDISGLKNLAPKFAVTQTPQQDVRNNPSKAINLPQRHNQNDNTSHQRSYSEFDAWIELLRKRAITHSDRKSETVRSAPGADDEIHKPGQCQKKENTTNAKIESGTTRDCDKVLKGRPVSPAGNTPDRDWNFLESDDDDECVFKFSPDAATTPTSTTMSFTAP